MHELSDGRILATLAGVRLEWWLPSGRREWAVPDEDGGREIAVTRDETTAWVSLMRPARHTRRTQSVVRLSLADGAQLDEITPAGYVSLSTVADGHPVLTPAGHWINGVPVAIGDPLRVRHARLTRFLSFVKDADTRRSQPGVAWVSTAEPQPGEASDRPAEPEETSVRRLFPYSWVPGAPHICGPGVETADGSLIHAGSVLRRRDRPGYSYVVRRDASDGTPHWLFRPDSSATALDADATTAFIACEDGEIVALGVDDGAVLWRHRLALGNLPLIPTALTVTRSGRLLIGTHDGRILLCSTTT
ncbi:PQQ-binding-like beta-propeller repeat protein [Streptomyces sp. NPDC048606]|uniref:outer membrane protein assembly factor BamB family protein n=1 Tax=Streptomyces sp. NPDC048606 TaxID=3154726 RepID=UPI00342382C0